MSVNSSSFSNASLSVYCFFIRGSIVTITAFNLAKILLFPLYIHVFYLGHQRWRRERSGAAMSHSDFITYNMIGLDIIGLLGGIFYSFAAYTHHPEMMLAGGYIYSMIFPGQTAFHILTCVERYLAVVHPITYLGLRKAGGVKIRNISIGCAWLLCFGWLCLLALYNPELPTIPYLSLLVFSIIVIFFCSLSVLLVLKRPGPSEVGGNVGKVCQSKQRAFYTIVVIMGVMIFWFVGLLVTIAMSKSKLFNDSEQCMLLISGVWFCLPSSLVLPLLFLHRAEKLLCYC